MMYPFSELSTQGVSLLKVSGQSFHPRSGGEDTTRDTTHTAPMVART